MYYVCFFFNFHHHFVMLLFQPAYVQLLNLKRVKFKNLVLAELKVANCELKGCVMLPIRIEETTTINNPPSPSPLGNKKWAAAEASLNTPICFCKLNIFKKSCIFRRVESFTWCTTTMFCCYARPLNLSAICAQSCCQAF